MKLCPHCNRVFDGLSDHSYCLYNSQKQAAFTSGESVDLRPTESQADPTCPGCRQREAAIFKLNQRLVALESFAREWETRKAVRPWRKFWGRALSAGSILAGTVTLLALFVFNNPIRSGAPNMSEREWDGYASVALGAIGSLFPVLFLVGRRLQLKGAAELMKFDPRPPVLLLRAFEDDRLLATYGQKRHTSFWVLGLMSSPLEDILARWLSQFGPVVAIGRPGEGLPPLGASRLYVSNDTWKDQVDTLLLNCRYVVMVMGKVRDGDGLSWEYSRLFNTERPEKIILLVPPLPEYEIVQRWEKVRELSDGKLPEYRGGEVVVGFSTTWTPQIIRISGRRKIGNYLQCLDRWIQLPASMDGRGAANRSPSQEKRQVVGLPCGCCQEPIRASWEGGLCSRCGSGIHFACSPKGRDLHGAITCPQCSADAIVNQPTG